MRSINRLTVLAALVAASVSCGDVVRQGTSPVLLVITSLQAAQGSHPGAFLSNLNSDVITNVTTPAPCTAATPCPTVFNDLGQAVMTVVMKDVSVTPSTNNQVTIKQVHVEFVRSDGRNVQGVDVPYAFDTAVTATVAVGGTASIGFELVRPQAKQETPLVQLIQNPIEISTIAHVTFYGTDIVGNQISIMGSITVDFANFGDQ